MSEQLNTQLATRETWQQEMARQNAITDEPLSNLKPTQAIDSLSKPEHAYDALLSAVDVDESPAGIAAREYIEGVAYQEPDIRDVMSHVTVRQFLAERDLRGDHAKLADLWPRFVEMFSSKLSDAIQIGYIPQEVAERFIAATNKTSVSMIDEAILGGIVAYYKHSKDELGLNRATSSLTDYLENLAHEFVHKLSGGTFVSDAADAPAERRRTGYASTNSGGEEAPVKHRHLNEAVTHHVTQGILHGDFETVDPEKRTDGDLTYMRDRKVLAAYITRSQGVVKVKSFTRALFEDTEPGGGMTARRQLIGEVRQAYGPGALNKFELFCEASNYMDDDSFKRLLDECITPPLFNDEGVIVAKGVIDTDKIPDFQTYLASKNTKSNTPA